MSYKFCRTNSEVNLAERAITVERDQRVEKSDCPKNYS